MDEIRILQLGQEDWRKIYALPEGVALDHAEAFRELPEKPYDMFFLDRNPLDEEIELLFQGAKAYTLFVTDRVEVQGRAEWLCRSRKARHIARTDIQRFLTEESRYYYSRPYGEKFRLADVAIAQGFQGKVRWNGNQNVLLEADFGDAFRQVAYWRYNSPVPQGQAVDFWLEYHRDPEVEISMVLTLFAAGSASDVLEQWELGEGELEKVVQVACGKGDGTFFVSLRAKGRGRLWLTALHKRISRGSHGYFLPGGERYVTAGREEAFCYFEPGDMKPPLNVYFSGYKTLQGFEGYYMMRGLGCPFLQLWQR